jgi:hypothetical protein
MLNEKFNRACSTPLPAAVLRDFVQRTREETGLNIVYGDKSLERDDWIFDMLTNVEYKKRFRALYKNSGDMLVARATDFFNGITKAESDVDCFKRMQNFKKRLLS